MSVEHLFVFYISNKKCEHLFKTHFSWLKEKCSPAIMRDELLFGFYSRYLTADPKSCGQLLKKIFFEIFSVPINCNIFCYKKHFKKYPYNICYRILYQN